MKIKLYILILSFSFVFTQEQNELPIKEFIDNGKLDALLSKQQEERLYLVQLDMKTDSLVERAVSIFPDIQLYGGRASYHRLMSEGQYVILRESFNKSNYRVIDQDYQSPNTRDYWAMTLQGNQYSTSSGETNNSCMCLDTSDCVVVGYNDSWYNPFDYYGEVAWSFPPPNYDEVLEARIYVAGVQCDYLPLSSETTLSVKNNNCSWSDFQVTLSESNTVNGPYVINNEMLNDVWCSGTFQPVIGSEDNYNVNWVQVELYYICETENTPNNFLASQEEFCDYVNLNWSNTDGVDGYTLYRDGEFVISLNSSDNSYSDYFAQTDIEHEYCLSAINGCGESEWTCVIGSRKNEADMISDISVSNDFVEYIDISWAISDNAQYYYLYRDESLLSIIPSSQELYYQDLFVEQNTVYEYCIEAVNDCGTSAWFCNEGSLALGVIGDINLDTQIDVLDIVILLNYILELNNPTDEQLWLADINQDGILNVLDVVILVNIILEQ